MSETDVGNRGDGTMPYDLRHKIGEYLGGGKRKTRKTKRKSKRKTKRRTKRRGGNPPNKIQEKGEIVPRIRIAIITMYRNNPPQNTRQQHKDKFLEDIQILKPFGDFDVYLIEQSRDNNKFNIGKLKNIGFQKAIESGIKYDFFIFTDADIIPDEQLAPYYFKPIEGISCLATRGTRYQGSNCFMGSCIGIDARSYQQINGYPNNFWGWGGEDESLLIRCNINNINIFVPMVGSIIDLETNLEGQQITIGDKMNNLKKDKTKENTKIEKEILETKIWEINGLNQLDYNELSRSVSNENNYPLYYYLIDLKYNQDHLNQPTWFDLSEYDIKYEDLIKLKKQIFKKYKKCKFNIY